MLPGAWAVIADTAVGNLSGIMAQWSFIAGKSAQLLTLEQWLALLYSSVAVWVYNVEAEVAQMEARSME